MKLVADTDKMKKTGNEIVKLLERDLNPLEAKLTLEALLTAFEKVLRKQQNTGMEQLKEKLELEALREELGREPTAKEIETSRKSIDEAMR